MQSAEDIMINEYDRVKHTQSWMIDVTRFMTVVELDYGVVVEVTQTDEEGITLTETLFSCDRRIFTIIGRWRNGGDYHCMKSYPRDNQFPLKSKVRLC
jgi:hypothetical protein